MHQEQQSEKCIRITHFINPHLFWYECVPNDAIDQILQTEQKLAEYYVSKAAHTSERLHPDSLRLGDKVAVHYLPWNKYIRVQVDEMVHFLNNTDEYIVWALDYGFPFQTKLTHARQLPVKLGEIFANIRRGGLADVLPAEMHFDFLKGHGLLQRTERWHENACEPLEKILADAATISFVEMFESPPAGHVWGELIIINHQGSKFKAREYLCGLNLATQDSGGEFGNFCATLASTNIKPWLANNGNNKYQMNSVEVELLAENCRYKRSSELWSVKAPESVQLKVHDWRVRNKREHDHTAEDVCSLPSVGEDLMHDIDDSVSVKQQSFLQEEKSQNSKIDIVKLAHIYDENYLEVLLPPTANQTTLTKETYGAITDLHPSTDNSSNFSRSNQSNSSQNRIHQMRIWKQLISGKTTHAQNEFDENATSMQQDEKLESDVTSFYTAIDVNVPVSSEARNDNSSRKFSSRRNQLMERSLQMLENSCIPNTTSTQGAASISSTNLSDSKRGLATTDAITSKRMHSSKVKSVSEDNRNDDLASCKSSSKGDSKADSMIEMSIKLKQELRIKALSSSSSPTPPPLSLAEQRCQKNLRNRDELNLLPAGIDLMRLAKYKDKNHWHLQSTASRQNVKAGRSHYGGLRQRGGGQRSELKQQPSQRSQCSKIIETSEIVAEDDEEW